MANSKCKCGVEFTLENSTATVFKRKCGFCRACDEAYQQDYYRERAEEKKKAAASWSKKNPEKRRRISRKWGRINTDYFRAKAYGVTPEEFDEKFEKQKGLCAICQQPMTGKRKPCQDHNHKSGENRDLLCSSCNCLLGYCYENKKILANAIKYLQKHANGSLIQTEGITAT
jgi:hypothetical protein